MARTGPSVYFVRLLGTMVLRNVGIVIVVPVGCFREADQASTLSVYLARYRSHCRLRKSRLSSVGVMFVNRSVG
jgi:hypothetical protein